MFLCLNLIKLSTSKKKVKKEGPGEYRGSNKKFWKKQTEDNKSFKEPELHQGELCETF